MPTGNAPPLQVGTPPVSAVDIPITVIERSKGGLPLKLRELWDYRELLYFLIWRDVKVRYKQTVIGAAWVIIQPLLTMLVFTFIFQRIANISSEGVPYPLFSFVALVPWNYFSRSLTNSIASVVGNTNLITKVYFPRLLLPISATLSGLIDLVFSFTFLIVLMLWYRVVPNQAILLLPVFVALTMLTALSVSLWLSVINVRYRDVGQAIPFLTQIWLFASPVVYPVSQVPENLRFIYGLNPMAGIIEGFRWALLGTTSPPFNLLALSMLVVLGLLWGGIVFFRRMEQTFADVV